MLSYLLFFFLTVGAKLVLATIMIYYLLPADRTCTDCDGETLLMGGNPTGRLWARVFLGRVQWRWCPRCGREGMTRRTSEARGLPGAALGSTARTRR